MIEDLIDCDCAIDYVCLVTGKIAIEKVIGLDTGVFTVKNSVSLIFKAFEVDEDDI